MQRADHRLLHAHDSANRAVIIVQHIAHMDLEMVHVLLEPSHITTGHEALARALQHYGAHSLVRFNRVHDFPQRHRHFWVERIQHFGTVQGDNGNCAFALD